MCIIARELRSCKKIAKCFVKQRYKDKKIQKRTKEVANMSRESLPNVNPTKKLIQTNLLAITYHHKFTVISKIISNIYERMIKRFPETHSIFPVLPVRKLYLKKLFGKM